MKKVLLSFAALTALSMTGMLFFNQGNAYSNATGAPGPGTCSQVNCHNSNGPATENTDVFLTVKDSLGNVVNQYKAGSKYTVTVGKNNTTAKVGFALSTNAGTLAKNTGDNKVQRVSGGYLTHTFAGTSVLTGDAQWAGTWTAPTSGNVTLTLFINETNSSGAVDGDLIFTKTVSLNRFNTGLNTLTSDIQFKVFPNPSSDLLQIALDVKYPSPLSVTLTGLDGKETVELMNEEVAKGNVEESFDISHLAKGIYLMTIRTNEGVATQKIFIN